MVAYSYDAWGKPSVTNYTGATTAAKNNPFTYRGYYYDKDLELYYLNSRYYDPIVKRFISPDCFVSTGQGFVGYNMFAYCNNNPVMYVDPTGDFPWLVIIILVACTAIGATMGATSDEKLFENPKKTLSNANPSTNELGENQELSNGEFDEKQELTVGDRVANAFIGGALGLAAGGAIVATGGGAVSLVVGSATEYVTLLGMSGAQAFAIGSLSYNIFPMIVAPFFGIESEPIELP